MSLKYSLEVQPLFFLHNVFQALFSDLKSFFHPLVFVSFSLTPLPCSRRPNLQNKLGELNENYLDGIDYESDVLLLVIKL